MASKPRVSLYKPSNSKLSQRMAEEAQLLAEEKWIIEALKKLKAQRNGLQIERLHLESMQSKILAKARGNPTQAGQESTEQPSSSGAVQDIPAIEETHVPLCTQLNVDVRPNLINLDIECNTEELNLSVTNSVFNTDPCGEMDEEEDEEDMDNYLLDMDLLMTEKINE